MFGGNDIRVLLDRERNATSKEDALLQEARKVLVQGRLSDKHILDNLRFYNSSFEFLDDEEIDMANVFSVSQLKSTAKKLHLRFLPSQAFEGEVPYEAVLKIKDLNNTYRKELKHFKILSTKDFFTEHHCKHQALLFAQTISGHYYLVHVWGEPLGNWRKTKFFVLRNFESLMATLFVFTLTLSLLIPDRFLSTDTRATYFSMYRMAGFFHLLILNLGFTIFILFAFHLNFSEYNWDSPVKRKNS